MPVSVKSFFTSIFLNDVKVPFQIKIFPKVDSRHFWSSQFDTQNHFSRKFFGDPFWDNFVNLNPVPCS